MIISEGYSICQEVKKNRIIITLPQTMNSITSTAVPFSGRRERLTESEEAVILNIVKAMYKNEEVSE